MTVPHTKRPNDRLFGDTHTVTPPRTPAQRARTTNGHPHPPDISRHTAPTAHSTARSLPPARRSWIPLLAGVAVAAGRRHPHRGLHQHQTRARIDIDRLPMDAEQRELPRVPRKQPDLIPTPHVTRGVPRRDGLDLYTFLLHRQGLWRADAGAQEIASAPGRVCVLDSRTDRGDLER